MALRGEGGRLVSSLFIHYSFSHLLGNLGLLWVLAAGTEVSYGPARTAVVYFAAGVGGNLLSAVTEESSCLVVVGSSGAIYGLIGLYTASLVVNFEKIRWPFMKLLALMATLAAVTGLQVASGAESAGAAVSHVSHVGGVLAGACVAALFLPDIRGNEWRMDKRRMLRRWLHSKELLRATVRPQRRPPLHSRRLNTRVSRHRRRRRPPHPAAAPSPTIQISNPNRVCNWMTSGR